MLNLGAVAKLVCGFVSKCSSLGGDVEAEIANWMACTCEATSTTEDSLSTSCMTDATIVHRRNISCPSQGPVHKGNLADSNVK